MQSKPDSLSPLPGGCDDRYAINLSETAHQKLENLAKLQKDRRVQIQAAHIENVKDWLLLSEGQTIAAQVAKEHPAGSPAYMRALALRFLKWKKEQRPQSQVFLGRPKNLLLINRCAGDVVERLLEIGYEQVLKELTQPVRKE